MTPQRFQVMATANFEANLREIQRAAIQARARAAFAPLVDELANTIIPGLARFSGLGRSFRAEQPRSLEAMNRLAAARNSLGDGELREYLAGDYLIVYAVLGETIHLLSITHRHRLSSDLSALWLSGGTGGNRIER